MDQVAVFRRMIKQLPSRFEIADGPAMVNGVVFEIDKTSGKAVSIRRIQFNEITENIEKKQGSDSTKLSKTV
jgi:2',3'-cyclic-nucleotide 2'-phosphodiesterase